MKWEQQVLRLKKAVFHLPLNILFYRIPLRQVLILIRKLQLSPQTSKSTFKFKKKKTRKKTRNKKQNSSLYHPEHLNSQEFAHSFHRTNNNSYNLLRIYYIVDPVITFSHSQQPDEVSTTIIPHFRQEHQPSYKV